ncbi:TfuA-like protein [Streptomyces sp. NPDC056773]|uniref:TfuA-like protein n=1 Tax=unclassified Streptomyces TaxID=2593676 RepID=UPI00367EC561
MLQPTDLSNKCSILLGVGTIYTSYVRGELDGDDEVAVGQAPDGQWDALTWPLVTSGRSCTWPRPPTYSTKSGPPNSWRRCARSTTRSAPPPRCGPCAAARARRTSPRGWPDASTRLATSATSNAPTPSPRSTPR